MYFRHETLHITFIALLLVLVRGQQTTLTLDSVQNAQSVDDFLALLHINGRQLTPSDIFSEYDSESGVQLIQGGGRMAEPDGCSPRDTTVELHFDQSDPLDVYFPKCTKVHRCGGCTNSPNLECVPAYTERISLQVLKARKSHPGSTYLEYTGFAPVIVDRHVTCRVECKITASDCGPLKRFLPNQCECRCLEDSNRVCNPPKVWDPETCQCKCAQVSQCCDPGVNCAMVFNNQTCECDVDVSAISANSQSRTQQADPCAAITCPARFTKMRTPSGTCGCVPPQRSGRRGSG